MAISSASGIASSCADTASNFFTLSSKITFGSFPLKSASVKNWLDCSSLSFGRRNGFRVDAVVKRSPKRSKYSAPPPVKVVSKVGDKLPVACLEFSVVTQQLPYCSKDGGIWRMGDGVLYLKVDPSGADAWRLEPVIELIKGGAVGVIPTDTIYAIVCDLKNRSAVERLHRVKKMDAKKPLGILCHSFRDIDTYTTGFPHGNSEGQTNIFRAARQCLPGPYTFILPASKEMPKECTKFGTAKSKYAPRKSVGVRMPNDPICQAILGKLDGPLLCSSVRWPVDDGWIIDPAIIADIYGSTKGQDGVDFVVDGGIRVAEPSTVIDMTGNEPLLLRKGKGALRDWMLPKANDFSWGG